MKKFHGKRVPKPRMKKIIHTALYLGKRKKEVHMDIKEFIQLIINKQCRTIYLLDLIQLKLKKCLLLVTRCVDGRHGSWKSVRDTCSITV